MESQPEPRRQRTDKLQIPVRLGPTQPVMQMRHLQHQSQLTAPLRQRPQQGQGIRATGYPNRQSQPRPQQRSIQRQTR